MMRESPESKTLRDIVRGDRAWSELVDIGIAVRINGDKIEIANPRQLSISVGADDLARGILSYKHDPVKIREWAVMILADAISCDLRLKDDADEQALLAVIWDLSFGKGLSDKGLALAQRFARRRG